jgi:16S rRNA (cytosine1402-N4)-methyltransferase
MRQAFVHEPVMVGEVVELFAAVPPGIVVDATVGGGGHAAAILVAHRQLRVLGLDRDADAVSAARERLARFADRAEVRRARFDRFGEEVAASVPNTGDPPSLAAPAGVVSGVLFDLGVSSPQFDRPERGFSYRFDGPLDMRMDPSGGPTAADLVNTAGEQELTDLFKAHGETRFAGRIAHAIVEARPLFTTVRLADVVRGAIPAAARRHGGHPARRVFQALRVAVNEELEQLEHALDDAIDMLLPGGRVVVIAYHSGEDRLVKARFARAASGGCTCPPGLPCVCGARPVGRLVFRGARRPAVPEVARNPRADSARLRALQRVESSPPEPAAPRPPVHPEAA